MQKKVLIADENELTRMGLKTVIRINLPEFKIFEAVNKDQLQSLVKEEMPDVLVIDYTTDEFSLRVLPEIKKIHPSIKILAITFLPSSNTIVDALKAGVMSYVKKDCCTQEIADAVKETAEGQRFFCGTVLSTVKAESINVDEIEYDPLSCAPLSLSEREAQIIRLVAQGFTNAEIAEKLFISPHTVTTHRKKIMTKLGVNNTAGIVMYAVKSQLVSPNKFLFSVD